MKMTDDERKALLVEGSAAYKKPLDVVIDKAEKHDVLRGDGGTDRHLILYYDPPHFWPGTQHTHIIPSAALASRAVAYGLDPQHPEFLADVLEHLIYERHHPEAAAHPLGLLPAGVTPETRQLFKVDKAGAASAAAPHVDLEAVAKHAADLAFQPKAGWSTLPPWLQPKPTIPLTQAELTQLTPAELLRLPFAPPV